MLFAYIIIYYFVAGPFAVYAKPDCPNVTGVDIDLNRIAGTWYEYATTSQKYKDTLKCITHDWSLPENGVVTMLSSGISKKTGNYIAIEREVTVHEPDYRIDLVTNVPLIGERIDHFWELDVVYDSYAISWTCKDEGTKQVQAATIYTRRPYPFIDVIGITRQVLAKNGLSISDFRKYDTNCY